MSVKILLQVSKHHGEIGVLFGMFMKADVENGYNGSWK